MFKFIIRSKNQDAPAKMTFQTMENGHNRPNGKRHQVPHVSHMPMSIRCNIGKQLARNQKDSIRKLVMI